MKKLIYLIAAAALFGGLAGCSQKEQEVVPGVDLRYRAESEYNLSATGAKAFTIVVTSSAPWSITSQHPDWCIISTAYRHCTALLANPLLYPHIQRQQPKHLPGVQNRSR